MQGFELNTGQWLAHEMLAAREAMNAWVRKRAAIQLWQASSHADWACLSACASQLAFGDFMMSKPFTSPTPQ